MPPTPTWKGINVLISYIGERERELLNNLTLSDIDHFLAPRKTKSLIDIFLHKEQQIDFSRTV